MPCYTVKKTTVNVSAMNLEMLKAGLQAAGFVVMDEQRAGELHFHQSGSYRVHQYKNGVLTVQGDEVQALTNAVKRAYAAQVIRSSMTRAGWKLSEKTTAQGINLQASKRG